MKVARELWFLWVVVLLFNKGVNGQFTVTIVSNPAGTPVSGSTNTFDYPILSNVTLTCNVTSSDGSTFTVDSYQWGTGGCFTNDRHNTPTCFPTGLTTQNVTGNNLLAEDAGNITCTVTVNGTDYTSGPLTLRISGVAVTEASTGGPSVNLVDGNQTLDYSFITQPFTLASNGAIFHCASGLGPSGSDRNVDLGGWYFNGIQISVGINCSGPVFEVRGANGRNYPGVINLHLCGTFTTTEEGVYSCIMMNSSMMNQTMRVGVYFGGRTAPMIDPPSSSTVTVVVGDNVTLSCTSQGSPPDSFTLTKNGMPVTPSPSITAVSHTDSEAVFQINVTIINVTTSDSGTYTCTVTNPIGSDSEIISVDVVAPTPVVTAPNNQTVGQPLTLECSVTFDSAISNAVNIIWSSNSITPLDTADNITPMMSGSSVVYTDTYTIMEVGTDDDGREYQCEVVINTSPPVMATGNITLDVMVPTPTVTISPSGPIQDAMVGSPQMIQCTVSTVSGMESSSVMISWMGPRGDITSDSRVIINPTTSSGNTYTSSIQFTYLMEEDEGTYMCNVTILETSRSDSVVLETLTIPEPEVTVTTPNNQTVGQSLTLECSVTAMRGITSRVDIIWSRNSNEVERMEGVSVSSTVGNMAIYKDTYTISQLSTTDRGIEYECTVMINANSVVRATDSVALDVTVPPLVITLDQPVEHPDTGSGHSISCWVTVPTGVDPFLVRIDWTKDIITLTNTSQVYVIDSYNRSVVTKTVIFQQLRATDNGTYECDVIVDGFNNPSTGVIIVNVTVINTGSSSSSSAGPIIGGVVAGLLILVVILLVLILLALRYRRSDSAQVASRQNSSARNDNSSLSSKNSLLSKKNGSTVPASPADIPMTPLDDNMKQRMEPIAVSKFPAYVQEMHKDRDLGFETEYGTISDEPKFTCEVAMMSANVAKNRYLNINPYDYARVKLLQISGKGKDTDYINASYIDGFQKPNAYIAAQGPLPETVKDFWQMIWDHKLQTIVMLTKPVEAGTPKCAIYWPEKVNETLVLKPSLHVRMTYLQYFADFDMRVFEVTDPQQSSDVPLEVKHFFFTSWPDHGVPQFATALISFIKKVRKNYSSNGPPMVVHCSAGVGRSGTYITLDTMLQRMAVTQDVNVYEFVHNMRMKRVFMVQTQAQYTFIHDALEELITCGETAFNVQDMVTRVNRLNSVVAGKGVTGFKEQFDLLQQVSRKWTEGDCSDALSQHNVSKNRDNSCVPYNISRVQMKATPLPGSDYINASFVDGYKQRNAFIATQCPMENTTNDFWRMMWESQSAVIVLLSNPEHDKENFYQFWPDEETEYGKVKVSLKSKNERNSYNGYKFSIVGEAVKAVPLQVTLLHYTAWPSEKAPSNTKAILGVTKELLEIQRHTGNKAITVMCSDGCGRTGSFIAIYYTLERVKAEQTVDIFQAIKNSRIRRTALVSNVEQYQHCHQAVLEFLDEFSAYANFT